MTNSPTTTTGSGQPLQLLAALPHELANRLFTEYTTGRDLSTLSLALVGCQDEHHQALSKQVMQIGAERVRKLTDFIETQSSKAYEGKGDECVAKAVAWMRSVQTPPSPSAAPNKKDDDEALEEPPLSFHRRKVRFHSQTMALLDFLQESVDHYSRPELGQFEWPVWLGQICVELSHNGGKRVRQTARVVITTPMQQPSFIPGAALMSNQTPLTTFRAELYNMVPVPPWGSVRPLSVDDDQVLQPVAERLESRGHVAVPSGLYHMTDLLDVRIVTARQAERLLSDRAWRPRTDWMVRSDPQEGDHVEGDDEEEPVPAHLICCWQDDSVDLKDDREYLNYIVELLKARKRLTRA